MKSAVSDYFNENLTIIDLSGKQYSADDIQLAKNYYQELLNSLDKKPTLAYINSNNLITIVSALDVFWKNCVPVFVGEHLPGNVDVIVSQQDIDGVTVFKEKLSFEYDIFAPINNCVENSTEDYYNETAIVTLGDQNTWPTGLVKLTHKDVLYQSLFVNKEINFAESDLPLHPQRVTLASLVSYTFPALFSCQRHYDGRQLYKKDGLLNQISRSTDFYKRVSATHIFPDASFFDSINFANTRQVTIDLSDLAIVTTSTVTAQVANTLFDHCNASSLTCCAYANAVGVYACNKITKETVADYVHFIWQSFSPEITIEPKVDGTLLINKQTNVENKLFKSITKTNIGYVINNLSSVYVTPRYALNLGHLKGFLTEILGTTNIKLVAEYKKSRLHLFYFDQIELDLVEINKRIYNEFVDIESDISNCITHIHHIPLDPAQPIPSPDLLLSSIL